jgi:hypothetical protein
MKRLTLLILALVVVAFAAKRMRIHMADNTETTVAVADIDSITFEDIGPEVHADVMVCWANSDSVFVADSAGENGRVIAVPFLVDDTPDDLRRLAIGPGNSEYCFYIEWRDAGEVDTLYIVDDLSGANLRKIPQPYQETLRDIAYTPSGDIVLAYYNGTGSSPVYRLAADGADLVEVFDLGDELSNVYDIDFDSQGRMYVVEGGTRLYRFASEEGGSVEELITDSLVSDPDNPAFTEMNSIDIDRATATIYMDADDDSGDHCWIEIPDFSGTGATFTSGFALHSSGGDYLQTLGGETFFVYDDDDGAAYVYTDFTDPNSGTLLVDRPNIRDIAVNDE